MVFREFLYFVLALPPHPFLSSYDFTRYNGLLSLYYLLTVRYGVQRDVFAKKYEPWFHMLAILFFVGTATAGLAMGMYSENQ